MERKKITVTVITGEGSWGDKNIPTLKFKAKDGDSEHQYEIFGARQLIEVVKASINKEIDCDIETVQKGDYTNRKIKEIYQDGEPISKPAGKGRGVWQGKSPEERQSIERQTCLRCACDIYPPGSENIDKILQTASQMFEWLRGNPEPSNGVKPTIDIKPITPEQMDKLNEFKKSGYDIGAKVKEYKWKVAKLSELNLDQADRLIKEYKVK